MTAYRARVLVFAFLLIFTGVAGNAMLMQGDGLRWKKVALLTPKTSPARTRHVPKPRPVRHVLPRWTPEVSFSDTSASEHAKTAAEPDEAPASLSVSAGSPADRETVRAIQRELSVRGYEPGPVDGILGIMTRAAVMAYEHDEKLPLTADPSPGLLERIILGGVVQGATRQRKRSGKHARLIARSVQDSLARLGYMPGPADGIVSTNTARAIKAFERDHDIAPSGRISGRLISRLGRVNGSRFSVAAGW
ncbi:MAG: peptidoglycan-binding domain-containing protein [Hyphomicrobiaceae bacterium]